MDRSNGFDFGVGPLVFKGKLDADGRVLYAQRDLGPYGSNVDEVEGRPFDEALKAEMIRGGYERVKQFAQEYRDRAAELGVAL